VELPSSLPEDLLAVLKRTRVRQMPLNIRALSAAEAAATPERRRPPRDEGWRAPAGDERPRKPFDAERRPRPEGGYAGKGRPQDRDERPARAPAPHGKDAPRKSFDKAPRPYDAKHKPFKRRDS